MKKHYKYETHVHDCIGSACAHNTPEEMVQAYFDAGYSGMCFTNHFYRGNTAVNRLQPWKGFVTAYWKAYQRAVAYAEENCPDFTVLFGIEHAYGGGMEVLTYGIDLEFLLAHPKLHRYSIEDYCDAVHQAGGFISHAHPYREAYYIDNSYPLNPECWDAVEVYNHYNKPADANAKAETLARAHGLLRTSGGDEHWNDGKAVGKAGMAFEYPIRSSREFVEALRRGDGKCIIDGVVEE